VDLTFRSPSAGLQTAEFLLHRQLAVTDVRGPAVTGYTFDTAATIAIPWIREGGRLEISFREPLAEGEHTDVHFEYGGVIDAWPPWSANVITEDWTELGLYFPWFPYANEEYGPFTFEVDVMIAPGYEVRGSGEAVRTDGGWRLHRDTPVRDIVLVASPDLETSQVEADGYRVQLHFTSLADSVARRIGGEAVSVLTAYGEWYGASDERELTLVESKRELGGGYARTGLIVLSRLGELATAEHHADLLRYLAHEAGHFWWTLAPADTWQDWLNESFAEYSALLLLRDRFGEEEFRARMDRKRESAEGTPPIWGFDRGDTSTEEKSMQVEAVLYSKGPVLLNELAERISQPRFLAWCQRLALQEVGSTEEALEDLRALEGEAVSDWFEQRLRGGDGVGGA